MAEHEIDGAVVEAAVVEAAVVDAVVFDFGGVLTVPVQGSTSAWLAGDDIVVDSYAAVMREWLVGDGADGSPVHRLETGELSGGEFEAALAARLVTRSGVPVSAEGLLGACSRAWWWIRR